MVTRTLQIVAVGALGFLALHVVSCPAGAEESSTVRRDAHKKAAIDCKRMPYTKQCERFWEQEFKRAKGEEFCLKHPEEDGCENWQVVLDQRASYVARFEAEKELADYCQANPATPRCIERKQRLKIQNAKSPAAKLAAIRAAQASK